MEFREGMLGVVVVALALTGALFASYFAGIDSEQVEYTDYDYLADISGLFTYDQSPTYIEFDPSTNYTGYYSESTGEYWPEELVDYNSNVNPTTGTPRANNYKVNLSPTSVTELTADVETLDPDDPLSGNSNVVYFSNTHDTWVADSVSVGSIADLINKLQLPDNVNEIFLSSEGAYTEDNMIEGDQTVDWNLFTTKSMWVHSDFLVASEDTLYIWSDAKFQAEGKKPGYVGPPPYPGMADAVYHKMCLSCVVDVQKGVASLYSDKDHTILVEQVTVEDALVVYGDGRTVIGPPMVEFNTDISVKAWEKHTDWLDPNYGVAMKE